MLTICNLISLQLFYCLVTLRCIAINPFVFSCSHAVNPTIMLHLLGWFTLQGSCYFLAFAFSSDNHYPLCTPHSWLLSLPSTAPGKCKGSGNDILILSPGRLPAQEWSQRRLHPPLVELTHPPSICLGLCFCHCPSFFNCIVILSSQSPVILKKKNSVLRLRFFL